MSPKIIVSDKLYLMNLIKEEIALNGFKCNLNHIDVSNMIDLSYLFRNSKFNGDISEWDTKNVKNMISMFEESDFNGDISNWNVSNVIDMDYMFAKSKFNGDISNWDVSKVENMSYLFRMAEFTGNISNWKPYNIKNIKHIFDSCSVELPYWANFIDKDERNKTIKTYQLKKELNEELLNNIFENKRIKI
jgi:surface protein